MKKLKLPFVGFYRYIFKFCIKFIMGINKFCITYRAFVKRALRGFFNPCKRGKFPVVKARGTIKPVELFLVFHNYFRAYENSVSKVKKFILFLGFFPLLILSYFLFVYFYFILQKDIFLLNLKNHRLKLKKMILERRYKLINIIGKF